MLLVLEPTGELAEPDPQGVRLLGIEAVRRPRWPALRHVYDLGEDAGLHLEVGPWGGMTAFAVGYTMAGDELLTAL